MILKLLFVIAFLILTATVLQFQSTLEKLGYSTILYSEKKKKRWFWGWVDGDMILYIGSLFNRETNRLLINWTREWSLDFSF